MWNIFKKNGKKEIYKNLSVYDIILNYIKSKGFTAYNKVCYFVLPFCYSFYYEKTDKYGNQLFFGFNGNEMGDKFGAMFICKNGMTEFINHTFIEVQQNPEKRIEFIESYFHRKYGWDNNLEK